MLLLIPHAITSWKVRPNTVLSTSNDNNSNIHIWYWLFLPAIQEYIYMDARERQYLRFFHKTADRSGFDVEKYNRIQDQLAQSKSDLERLQNNTLSSLALKQKDDATERL